MYYCTTSTVTHLVNVTVGIKSATSAAKELKKQMPLQTASGSHLSSVVKVSWKLEILFIYTCQKSQENQIQCSETIIDLTWTRAGHRKQSQKHEKKVSLIDKKLKTPSKSLWGVCSCLQSGGRSRGTLVNILFLTTWALIHFSEARIWLRKHVWLPSWTREVCSNNLKRQLRN